MAEIYPIPYKPEHADELFTHLREHDRRVIESQGGMEAGRRALDNLVDNHGLPVTFVTSEGRVVSVWVFMTACDGVAAAFSYMSDEIDKHPIAFVKACKKHINTVWDSLNLHRMEASVDAEYEKSMRWLESLGFEVEGIMRQRTTDKRDHLLMARVG